MGVDRLFLRGLWITAIFMLGLVTSLLYFRERSQNFDYWLDQEIIASMLSDSLASISEISTSLQNLILLQHVPQESEIERTATSMDMQRDTRNSVNSVSADDVNFVSIDTTSSAFRNQNLTQEYRKASLDAEHQIGWVLDQIGISEPRRSEVMATIIDAVSDNRLLEPDERNIRPWEIAPSGELRNILAETLAANEYSQIPDFESANADRYYRGALMQMMMSRSQTISYQTAEFLTDQIFSSGNTELLVDATREDFLELQARGFASVLNDYQDRFTNDELSAIEAFIERQAQSYPTNN